MDWGGLSLVSIYFLFLKIRSGVCLFSYLYFCLLPVTVSKCVSNPFSVVTRRHGNGLFTSAQRCHIWSVPSWDERNVKQFCCCLWSARCLTQVADGNVVELRESPSLEQPGLSSDEALPPLAVTYRRLLGPTPLLHAGPRPQGRRPPEFGMEPVSRSHLNPLIILGVPKCWLQTGSPSHTSV